MEVSRKRAESPISPKIGGKIPKLDTNMATENIKNTLVDVGQQFDRWCELMVIIGAITHEAFALDLLNWFERCPKLSAARRKKGILPVEKKEESDNTHNSGDGISCDKSANQSAASQNSSRPEPRSEESYKITLNDSCSSSPVPSSLSPFTSQDATIKETDEKQSKETEKCETGTSQGTFPVMVMAVPGADEAITADPSTTLQYTNQSTPNTESNLIDFHVTFGSEKDVISLPSQNLSMERLYTQIADDFKISEDFCLQYYMMKWNDWVRLKSTDAVKHGGKLNVIFSQSPRKENLIRNESTKHSSATKYQLKKNRVGTSPRSKLHASIDRIKKLFVPPCEGESLPSRDRIKRLSVPLCEGESLTPRDKIMRLCVPPYDAEPLPSRDRIKRLSVPLCVEESLPSRDRIKRLSDHPCEDKSLSSRDRIKWSVPSYEGESLPPRIRIKSLAVSPCESESLPFRDQMKRLSTSQFENESLNSANSSSTSLLLSDLSLQQDSSLTLFPWLQTHPLANPTSVKSEPGIARQELETSSDMLSNEYTSTLNDISMMGHVFTGVNLRPVIQNNPLRSSLYRHDVHSKSTHSQQESIFPVRTTDHFGSPHGSDSRHYSNKLAKTTCSSQSLPPDDIKGSNIQFRSSMESSPSRSFAIPDFAKTLITNQDTLPSMKSSPKARTTYSSKSLPPGDTRVSSIHNTANMESSSILSLADPVFENTMTMNQDCMSAKPLTQFTHSSQHQKIQHLQLPIKHKGLSTYSTSRHDMYNIPEREIPWSVREKLSSGEKLLDSERIRLMEVIYNHVTKFTFYPSTLQYSLIVDNFLNKYPSASLEGDSQIDAAELWKKRLKRKFQNVRARRDSRIPCVQRQKIGKRPSKHFLMTTSATTGSCWNYPTTEAGSDSPQQLPWTEYSDDLKPYQEQQILDTSDTEEETGVNDSNDD
ncbi:uncharacterized protein LOC121367611 isoform X2 [Gigantopelta aegis]|uniref:uncharacterized protein LOC121367611 isoform X2 n=1 Tax=Gigantopelta aegis TaxID=1735272 RepID=UPI001B88DF00|nr:uncharacterized protein LOC121367611 isoform X2 [Gigantopelta aegis]